MANSDLVGAVVKAMALVKLVASSPDGMRHNELAEAANLKKVTSFNLVRTLIAGGFLEKIDGKLYIGNEISHLSLHRFHTAFFRRAEEVLLHLDKRFPRATVIFAVPGKYGMEQTHRIAFDHPGVIQRLNSEALPPYASAAGLLGLAFIRDEDVLMRIEENFPFAVNGIPLWSSRKKLENFLAKCRREMIAVSPFDADIFRRVSVPVFDQKGNFVAVFGVSCPVRDFSGREFDVVKKVLAESAANFIVSAS